MVCFNTWRIIAFVTDEESLVKFSVCLTVSEYMNINQLSAVLPRKRPELPVSTRGAISSPNPAITRLIDSPPESFVDWYTRYRTFYQRTSNVFVVFIGMFVSLARHLTPAGNYCQNKYWNWVALPSRAFSQTREGGLEPSITISIRL